ncbi:YbaB/EbfC family nucleoid-associated protein [Nocardia fluminea]|uniref:YbaB/EbfC DNA-binding family protein n=1 Tax=Nocardia fluminea TaxID=134984 RepID=A0A2N3V8D7_9NOCA|nr:YbaB/EbfC family nucleoid-associated protein [Nocardia fluminea]PKV77890.1 YbaB/EbfC DNA-binding family protein [Nocardia fluminea]
MYPNSSDIDPITDRMDAVRRALLTDRVTTSRFGVAVDVRADGTVEAVRIDESVTPYGVELGNLITTLVREALDQARGNVRERIDELTADPRIASAVESIEIASEQPAPKSVEKTAPQKFPDEELSEEELIELNERRNQSWFR